MEKVEAGSSRQQAGEDLDEENSRGKVCQIVKLCGGRFPRVFGDEFGDKFCEKFGDSQNLVKTLVTNSVTKLVNHQIW